MTLTTFFTDKCKQVTNLHPLFFFGDNKRLLSNDELQIKARNAAITIAEDSYYNYSLEYDRSGLISIED